MSLMRMRGYNHRKVALLRMGTTRNLFRRKCHFDDMCDENGRVQPQESHSAKDEDERGTTTGNLSEGGGGQYNQREVTLMRWEQPQESHSDEVGTTIGKSL